MFMFTWILVLKSVFKRRDTNLILFKGKNNFSEENLQNLFQNSKVRNAAFVIVKKTNDFTDSMLAGTINGVFFTVFIFDEKFQGELGIPVYVVTIGKDGLEQARKELPKMKKK